MTCLRNLPWRTLALAAAALVVAALPGARPFLEFRRDALLDGELWRAWTSHLVHGSRYHLIWNVLGLVGVGFLFERSLGNRVVPLLVVASGVVSAGLLAFDPSMLAYCGLSGVLNALFVAGALETARREERDGHDRLAMLFRFLVLLDVCKIGIEAWLATPLFTDTARLGGPAVPLAHALGTLTALGSSLVLIHGPDSAKKRPVEPWGQVSF